MRFEDWLNQRVKNSYTREAGIQSFTKSLWHFIIIKGYAWKITELSLYNYIAKGLYDNAGKSHIASEWNYSNVNTDYSDDDLTHFLFIMDSDAWHSFWLREGVWGDFHEDDFRGKDRRQDIEAFVWKQLDLESSPQTLELYEYLLGGEEDTTQNPSVDNYLQESVEYNGWGGIRR